MIKLKSLLVESVTPDELIVKNLANAKGYTYETYRGDTYAGDIYSYSKKERREYGIFTTPIKEVAAVYAGDRDRDTPRKFYVRAPKLLDLTKDTMENMKWVMKWGERFDDWIDRQSGEETDAWRELEGGRMFDYEGDWSTERWMDIQMTADHQGYDAIILPDFDSKVGIFPSFVVFDEKNIKLSIPITHNDSGIPIPLENRFDRTSSDIRY